MGRTRSLAFGGEPSLWLVARTLLLQWVLISGAASAFFTLAPRLLSPNAKQLPPAEAILFPTVFFGVMALGQFAFYLMRSRTRG